MFNKINQKVVFATGVLLVLSLAVFGSLLAVAWMSMSNTMIVTSDVYSTESNGPYASTALAWNLDPGIVNSVDYRGFVNSVDYRGFVNSVDYRGFVNSVDHKDAVRSVDFKDSERVMDYNTL